MVPLPEGHVERNARDAAEIRLGVRPEDVILGPHELRPYPDRERAGEHEKYEGRHDVAEADGFVITVRQPRVNAAAVIPGLLKDRALFLVTIIHVLITIAMWPTDRDGSHGWMRSSITDAVAVAILGAL